VRAPLAGFAMALALFGRLPKLPAPTPAHPATALPPLPAPSAHELPLPMLPSLARVRVEAARDRVLVIEDIHLPRGEWRSGSLELYVAFGAPGPPIAVDGRLLTLSEGDSEARRDDAGDPVTVQAAPRPSPAIQVLLGRRQMAGVALRVKESQLRSAYASSDLAVLRVRTLLHPPAADDQGARELVVRLGAAGGLPMMLGRIQVASLEKSPWLSRAQARLCGPEADPWPLAVALVPQPLSGRSDSIATIAPSLAVRHATDDLCLRWWTVP
jgi:hypothetical protein